MTIVLQIALLLTLPATVVLVTSIAPVAFGATRLFGQLAFTAGQLIADELSRVGKQTT